MSRFNTLLKGLSETAPQIKGSLQKWAEELKILQANPAGNERRIKELSDNIRSTVEANAKREAKAGNILKEGPQTAMQKAAAFSPFSQGNPQEQLEQGVQDTGRKLVNRFMGDSSPENKALAQKTFETVANPMNLVGGAGLADLAMGAVEVAPEAYDAAKARFKGLFGN